MFTTRFMRSLVFFVVLGLAGLVLGCSGSDNATGKPDADQQAENKRIAEQRRAEMKAEAAERKKAMRGGR